MTICNWELGLTEPKVRFIPKIIEFLGYNPLPSARTLAEQIIRGRKTLGLSQKQLVEHLGVIRGHYKGGRLVVEDLGKNIQA